MKTISELPQEHLERLLREKRKNSFHWYVLLVQNLHEMKIAERFKAYNESNKERTPEHRYATEVDRVFVPHVMEKRKWSDRVVEKPKLLAPGLVFVRMKLAHSTEAFIDPYIKNFLRDKSKREPAIVPDEQMNVFIELIEGRQMNYNNELEVALCTPEVGDRVKIIAGPYEGKEGKVVRHEKNKSRFQLELCSGLAVQFSIADNEVQKI